MSQVISVERLLDGEPLIRPTENVWEDWMTTNSAALHLERSPENDRLIKKLLDISELGPELDEGVVVIHYRAVPRDRGGLLWFRSFVGLAVFDMQYQLLRRFSDPVLSPCDDPEGYDHISSEDPRITFLDGRFYMVYCGFTMPTEDDRRINVCLAVSEDLVTWEKLGPVQGEINGSPNKDGVLFPEKIHGQYYMLHRPMVGTMSDYTMELARCDSLDGQWENCGKIMQSMPADDCRETWLGAGTVPIKLGENRYLVIYHVAKRYKNEGRDYHIDAAILDFDRPHDGDWSRIVEKRLEPIMVPETRYEKNAPDDPDYELNVLFPCGSFERGEDIHIIYGGANTYVLAGKINRAELVRSIERDGFENPPIREISEEDKKRPVVI
ncbi:MAG: hypothetical protein MK171_12830 [Pirellulales bacterium]|nr:hypothetical protein [Pirellulales bacterium]